MTLMKRSIPLYAMLIAVGLMAVPTDYVSAQTNMQERNARNARDAKKDRGHNKGKAAPAFPKSSREEPEFTMSAKLGKKVQQGLEALEGEDYAKAEALFNEVLAAPKATPSEKATCYQALGSIAYERDEDSLKAIEYNVKAVETDALPNASHFGLIMLVAQLYLQEEQYDNAIAWADRWLTGTGEERDTLLVVKGQAYYQQEKYDLAAVQMKRALEVTSKPNDNWYGVLMASYTESENYAEAIRFGEEVIAKDPNNKTVIKLLSNVYIENDQEPKALALMDRAYASGLLVTEAELRQLAQLYAFAGKSEQGAKVIQDGLANGVLKESLSTYSLLGEVYSQGEDDLKTADAYAKAATFANDGDMKFRQAYALNAAGKAAEAKAAALEALKRVPFKHEGECWVILGNAEIELNNKAGAIAAFEKAVKFPATQKSAESWLKNVRRM